MWSIGPRRKAGTRGSISLVAYDAAFAFLGFYIVKPAFRGRGLGLALWREAMARRGRPLTGLDGVVTQQANYAKSGFRLAYRNIRFGGPAPAVTTEGKHPIVSVSDLSFDRVLACDRAFFPAPRPAFLSLWLAPRLGAAIAILDGDRIIGLGAIRACRHGFKIGRTRPAAPFSWTYRSRMRSRCGLPSATG